MRVKSNVNSKNNAIAGKTSTAKGPMPPAKVAIIPRHAMKPTGSDKVASVPARTTPVVARTVKPSILPAAAPRHITAAKAPMTPDRVAAIQKHTMKTDGTVKAGSFTARVQAAAARNLNIGIVAVATTRTP